MADDKLTLGEVGAMAARMGMTELSEEHLRQLLRATNTFRSGRKALPVAELTPADEPAHIFSLVKPISR